jgi:hypothetical protein
LGVSVLSALGFAYPRVEVDELAENEAIVKRGSAFSEEITTRRNCERAFMEGEIDNDEGNNQFMKIMLHLCAANCEQHHLDPTREIRLSFSPVG